MTSETNVKRFRLAVGDPGGATPVFSSDEIDTFFDEAAETYPDASARAQFCYAVIQGLNSLRARYAPHVNYTANAASENLSDIAKQYGQMIADWTKKLETALAESLPAVRWGSTRSFPSREEEWPDA